MLGNTYPQSRRQEIYRHGKKAQARSLERQSKKGVVGSIATDLPDHTPWRDAHVTELKRYIDGFPWYAYNHNTVLAFDLMVCGICCGAEEFSKFMWERSLSPIRAALVGC